eukprot:scaffold21632_cov101-Isochrysis_galbana.AAC.1
MKVYVRQDATDGNAGETSGSRIWPNDAGTFGRGDGGKHSKGRLVFAAIRAQSSRAFPHLRCRIAMLNVHENSEHVHYIVHSLRLRRVIHRVIHPSRSPPPSVGMV